MGNKHSVTYWKAGFKQNVKVAEYPPFMGFPNKRPLLKEKRIQFVNRTQMIPTKTTITCLKYSKDKFLKQILHSILQ